MARNTLSQDTVSGNIEAETTTTDMEKAMEWKYGTKLYGTFAKSSPGLRNWRRDINRAYGNENDYYKGNILYVDTFKELGPQLERLK